MRSSGRRSGRGRASTTTTSLPALRRHYRVYPQRLVVGSRAVPAGRWRHARGKSASDKRGRLRIWLHPSASEEAFGCVPRAGPERAPDRGSGPDRPSWYRERSLWAPKRPGAHPAARGRRGLRASWRGLRRLGTEVPERRGVSLAVDRRSGFPRAGNGRSRSRSLRDPSGARPSVAATRRWRLVFGRAGPKDASREGTNRSWGTHERHAAGRPTTPSLGFVPFRRKQHGRSLACRLT